jgi:hypothetical protein
MAREREKTEVNQSITRRIAAQLRSAAATKVKT